MKDPGTPAWLNVKTTPTRRSLIAQAKKLWPDEPLAVIVFRALKEAIQRERKDQRFLKEHSRMD